MSSGIVMNDGGSVQIGLVIIGRNEGERLRATLASVPKRGDVATLYVDSGSTDGSVELVESMGVAVHELDPARPFSAARARDEGVAMLLEAHPDRQWIQFVDGDCALEPEWIERAVAMLEKDPSIGVVCGMLSEAAPERSIYNRISDLHWRMPAGEIDACGGIFMIRREAYESAGGFNAALLTREEKDLCDRVRKLGYRIVRLDAPMAVHDAGYERFGQWWSRAVWGGYGDALQVCTQEGRISWEIVQRTGRQLVWPVLIPLAMVAGMISAFWSAWFLMVVAVGFAAYGVLFLRLTHWRINSGDSVREASLYALLHTVRKFPVGYGFVLFLLRGDRNNRRPDPHSDSYTSRPIRNPQGRGKAEDTRARAEAS